MDDQIRRQAKGSDNFKNLKLTSTKASRAKAHTERSTHEGCAGQASATAEFGYKQEA
jgi:hypothetical protein